MDCRDITENGRSYLTTVVKSGLDRIDWQWKSSSNRNKYTWHVDIGQISPVTAWKRRDFLDSCLRQWRNQLAYMILWSPTIGGIIVTTVDGRHVTDGVPHCQSSPGHAQPLTGGQILVAVHLNLEEVWPSEGVEGLGEGG